MTLVVHTLMTMILTQEQDRERHGDIQREHHRPQRY